MNRFSVRWACVLLVVGISTNGCATYKVHPDFKERQKSLETVACMPPEVQVFKVAFTGANQPMYELYPDVQYNTVQELTRIFAEKGYGVQILDLHEATLTEEPELRTTLYTVQETFKKNLSDIQKNRKKTFTYTMGSDMNVFADRAHSDALIMTSWTAYKKTGGEIAKDIVKGLLIAAATLGNVVAIAPMSEGIFQIAVVDGNTGDILWYHHNIGHTALDVAQESELKRTLKMALGPFPISSALAEKKKANRKAKGGPDTNFGTQTKPLPTTPPPSMPGR